MIYKSTELKKIMTQKDVTYYYYVKVHIKIFP